MSYRVQGSGSLIAVDREDQLRLEEKGDINGPRAMSGASVKWNPVLAVLVVLAVLAVLRSCDLF